MSSSSPSTTAVVVVPTTNSPSSTSAPSSLSSYTCSSGWFSCAASLGGGCCQNGRTCATGASCLGDGPTSTSTSTMAPSAPVRPTSDSGTVSAQRTTSTSPSDSACPAGFYVCSAYYPSGCCRVGLDCHTTGSCIPTASTTVVNSNGVVIVAPSGATMATPAPRQGGSCPSAWYSCAASLGGNCCPEGFNCGEQCTATSGSSVASKVVPNKATILPALSLWLLACSTVGIGAVAVLL